MSSVLSLFRNRIRRSRTSSSSYSRSGVAAENRYITISESRSSSNDRSSSCRSISRIVIRVATTEAVAVEVEVLVE